MLSHLRENEKCDGFNFKETQADQDHMPTSSLSANNLDSCHKLLNRSFYRTEIAFPVIDASLNTLDERFKENELDTFQFLKDVTCSDPSKIIKIASIQKVSETYNLDMEKIKGEIQIFQKMYKKYIDFLPEISTEITELRKRCNFLVETELCDIFPYSTKLIQILRVISISTASCERSF
ncbi:hypothetical protein AVEN_245930-1 [Araneus ventricosus]|uniref:HAT C-terminal dimerisation domain-containing protein n=1 Tax=Araneus ventricosus TaxID=182803 RepID=A0A4Y2Q032_ARAVE|nr:hypothetical protein AVEN_245930-1 [Araneus ventricosus]